MESEYSNMESEYSNMESEYSNVESEYSNMESEYSNERGFDASCKVKNLVFSPPDHCIKQLQVLYEHQHYCI